MRRVRRCQRHRERCRRARRQLRNLADLDALQRDVVLHERHVVDVERRLDPVRAERLAALVGGAEHHVELLIRKERLVRLLDAVGEERQRPLRKADLRLHRILRLEARRTGIVGKVRRRICRDPCRIREREVLVRLLGRVAVPEHAAVLRVVALRHRDVHAEAQRLVGHVRRRPVVIRGREGILRLDVPCLVKVAEDLFVLHGRRVVADHAGLDAHAAVAAEFLAGGRLALGVLQLRDVHAEHRRVVERGIRAVKRQLEALVVRVLRVLDDGHRAGILAAGGEPRPGGARRVAFEVLDHRHDPRVGCRRRGRGRIRLVLRHLHGDLGGLSAAVHGLRGQRRLAFLPRGDLAGRTGIAAKDAGHRGLARLPEELLLGRVLRGEGRLESRHLVTDSGENG